MPHVALNLTRHKRLKQRSERNEKNNPVILVSVSDGGVGSAIVSDLLAHGYRLSLGSLNAGLLTEKFGPESPERIYQPFDAFDTESARAWGARTADAFGPIGGLVNAIGGGGKVTSMEDNDPVLDRLF